MTLLRTRARRSPEETEQERWHRALAREAAEGSMVLLANNGALPVAPQSVALLGAGAATTIKGGTGSGEVNERRSVSVEEGLTNAGFTVTTGTWLRDYEADLAAAKAEANRAIAKRLLKPGPSMLINLVAGTFHYPPGRPINPSECHGADLGIYVLARQAGEAVDRDPDSHEFTLRPEEIEHLRVLTATCATTVLVINTGAAMDLSALDHSGLDRAGINVDAILFFCQQGMEGGAAFANVLTGAVPPSGCLTATWPKRYNDWPRAREYSALRGHAEFDEYREGVYVGYRYFDSFDVEPRYPFGYGLTYSDFTLDAGTVTREGSVVSVPVTVTHAGATGEPARKVVQAYVSVPQGSDPQAVDTTSATTNPTPHPAPAREFQHLAALGKTPPLSPGQSATVTLTCDLMDLSRYDEARSTFVLDAGEYILRLGHHSRDTQPVAVVTLDQETVTERCAPICPVKESFNQMAPPAPGQPASLPAGIQRLALSSQDIIPHNHPAEPAQAFSPEITARAAALADTLTINELVDLLCGTGIFDSGAFYQVPGAAAYTTSALIDRGVPNIALCDGPAGLRLVRHSVELKNGSIKPVDAMFGFMEAFPRFVQRLFFASPQDGEPLYQFATAFPVGTALAQTWDPEMVERVGEAMGAEMTEYGVAFLLAPGMNIQRNPLCGRNFEYFSEDPLLTGLMAAAVTRGVQSHPGCFVTLKHFAANNQEANRMRSDSRVHERPLREIYLRGFRRAVEAGALGVMTSYNKLNGVYTPNSADLCTSVLREEWGFAGIVMTDWHSTAPGLGGCGSAIAAGNDLLCPGGVSYRRRLRADVKAGTVTEAELRVSAARVLGAIWSGCTVGFSQVGSTPGGSTPVGPAPAGD
ncbi:MAG: glycoside hydrolase family 3 C-terminal domain-containing protein [Cellulomonadaceae bacterium]|jgi:beta-glucosidase|nr:glycoside hydrolase family 3 C-terminal domain-containing protein [Cellulomonadaceae bacterium]